MKVDKFKITDFYNKLDQVLSIPDSVFLADKNDEQDAYNLILSFTHFFNNLRDVMIFYQLIDSELRKVKPICDTKYGQFSGMKVFIDNLFFAFILEFMQLLRHKKNKSIINNDKVFDQILRLTAKKTQDDWEKLIKIIYKKDNKLFNTLVKIRNNLSFHFFHPKKIFEGYKIATLNPKNKFYISLGSKMSETRYYLYDLSNQIAIFRIIRENKFSLEEWRKQTELLINLIISVTMNITHRFITSRCAPSTTKAVKLPTIDDYFNNNM